MKKLLVILLISLLLTGCGNKGTTDEVPIDSLTIEEPEPLQTMYYYDLGGIYLNATAYFAPVGVVDDLEAWTKLHPKYAFRHSEGGFIYIGSTYDKSYSGFTYDNVEVCSKDVELVGEFDEALITLDGPYEYIELEPAILTLSSEVQQELIQNDIAGYDANDIIMYAIATTEDGHYIAVCKQDVGHRTQLIYIKPEELTCSLRDEELTLLVENTGELLPLEWYLNANYMQIEDEVPEITP